MCKRAQKHYYWQRHTRFDLFRWNFTLSTLRQRRICTDYVCAQCAHCARKQQFACIDIQFQEINVMNKNNRTTFNDSNVKLWIIRYNDQMDPSIPWHVSPFGESLGVFPSFLCSFLLFFWRIARNTLFLGNSAAATNEWLHFKTLKSIM